MEENNLTEEQMRIVKEIKKKNSNNGISIYDLLAVVLGAAGFFLIKYLALKFFLMRLSLRRNVFFCLF